MYSGFSDLCNCEKGKGSSELVKFFDLGRPTNIDFWLLNVTVYYSIPYNVSILDLHGSSQNFILEHFDFTITNCLGISYYVCHSLVCLKKVIRV